MDKIEMVKDARRYIELHLHDALDLEELAKRYGYSYSSFRVTFHDICGYTPHQYIRLRCIQEAAQLLREGNSISYAARRVGFYSRTGFYKAFKSVYKISPQEFLSSRGTALMQQPVFVNKPDFYLVGYVICPAQDFKPRDRGAYWMIQDFPPVSAKEFNKIGGGADTAALWVDEAEGSYYLLGPPVDSVRYVPRNMAAHRVPGGAFLEFQTPDSESILYLYENTLVTWYFARRQWLPQSPYEEDEERLAYEYYSEEKNAVLIPVKEKSAENRTSRKAAVTG